MAEELKDNGFDTSSGEAPHQSGEPDPYFPYKALYEKTQFPDLVKNLSRWKPKISNEAPKKGCKVPLYFNNKRQHVSILYGQKEYDEFDIANDLIPYVEQRRLQARKVYTPHSPWDLWLSPAFKEKMYAETKVKQLPTSKLSKADIKKLRDYIYYNTKECQQFKPSIVVFSAAMFHGTRMIDMCAGWGDRLLGALLSPNIELYRGFDPKQVLQKGYALIKEKVAANMETLLAVKPAAKLKLENYTVECVPFEDAIITERFDLALTSPPYFDVEIYAEDSTQSIKRYPDKSRWLVGFLYKSFDKIYGVLDKGAYFVLSLEVQDVCDAAREYLTKTLRMHYLGAIGTIGVSGVSRPLWIFRKTQ
jgi:hypothetical protein